MVKQQCEALSSSTVFVAINERDVLKLVLEFLECRRFHIAQLALERETGIINGKFTEDVLFLRQLILDGQWDSALDFVKPLKELERFRGREFDFLIYKYKYFELLCLKQEPGPLQDNEFTVEEIVQCLRELEKLCDNGDEFRQLCALLTLPKLSDHEHFRNWNPSSARCECFQTILPIVADFIDQLNSSKESDKEAEEKHSNGERLIQLVVKGLLYEYAVDYCQKQAIEGKNAPKPKYKFTDLFNSQNTNLSSNDLSLISWLEVLSNEQFTVPFHQRAFNFHLEALKKPHLDAQWTEQILATPIKPHGQFPYSLVPYSKLKSAQQQLSQSISASMVFEPGFHRSSSKENYDRLNFRTHSMSQSTFPSIGSFSIQKLIKNGNGGGEGERPHSLGNEAMRQSQIISDMLSESSAPSTARRSPPSQMANPIDSKPLPSSIAAASSSPPSFFAESENPICGGGAGAARQELEAFCRRNPPQSLALNNKKMANPMAISASSSTLPPVPELNTPIGGGGTMTTINEGNQPINRQMVQSKLFQEFQANQPPQQEMIQSSLYHQQYSMPISAPQIHPQPPPANYYSTMPPIAEQFTQPTMIGGGGGMAQYPQQMPLQPQQPMVMMRTQQPPNNYNIVSPPPMSSRPTSMIISSNQNQGQINPPIRPRSYLDQPSSVLPSDPNWQQSQYYSTMNTIPVEDRRTQTQQPMRKGSLDDEEFLEEENRGESSNTTKDGRTNGDGKSMASPVRFVPICRYEDAQAIRAVAFHPSGGHFAIGTNSRQLLICRYPDLNAAYKNVPNPPSPEILLTRPKQHRGSVYCATFNQTGELLATGSNDKTIRLMSVQIDADRCRIGAELELQRIHDGTVRDLIFMEERLSAGGGGDGSQQSNVLVSGGAGNCNIYVTDCNKGQTFQHFQGHTGPILGLNNWGSSTNFVSCSQDKTIRFWDLRASSATSVIWPTPRTSNSPVTSICIDPSGKLLISGHEDATIMLFDICGGRTIQLFRPHDDEIRTVKLSNAAYYLLSGSYDKRIVITDMRGNLAEPLDYLPVAEHKDKVIQCRWHPQDFVFLSTSADKCAVLWSLPPSTNID